MLGLRGRSWTKAAHGTLVLIPCPPFSSSDLTHTPDILIPGTLESGRPMDLTCSVPWACEGGTPPLFSWTSATHPSLVPSNHNSSVLTLTPWSRDNGATLTCEVTLPGLRVTKMRTVHLNVSCENWTQYGVSAGGPDGSRMGGGQGLRHWVLVLNLLWDGVMGMPASSFSPFEKLLGTKSQCLPDLTTDFGPIVFLSQTLHRT